MDQQPNFGSGFGMLNVDFSVVALLTSVVRRVLFEPHYITTPTNSLWNAFLLTTAIMFG